MLEIGYRQILHRHPRSVCVMFAGEHVFGAAGRWAGKYLVCSALLLFVTAAVYAGDSDAPVDASLPVRAGRTVEARPAAPEADPAPITADALLTSGGNIVDARGELLLPSAAARLLDRAAYFEWCLQWNRQQVSLAKQRAIAPRKITGQETTRRGSWQGTRLGGFYRGSSTRGNYRSTTRSRELVWYEGGYGGGPITLYNPFVSPR